jgi:mercuric ion transport protein
MSSTEMPELACVPGAIPVAQRLKHFALGCELLEARATQRMELPNGYAIRFEADAFEAVARFVVNERKCCPFLTFELTLDPGSGPLWLRMTGPDGTRAILDAELRADRVGAGQRLTSTANAGMSPKLVTTPRPGPQCNCASTTAVASRAVTWAAAAGILAALSVCAACCLLPFALLSVGVAGAWVSGLDAFAAYKWPLVGLAVLLLGYDGGQRPCATGGSGRAVRIGLWIATVLTIGGIVFEQIEPMLRQ